MIVGGLLGWPLSEASSMIRAWRDFMETAPEELGSGVAILPAAPPEEFVPADLQGNPMVGIVICWIGDIADGLDLLKPFKEASPAFDLVGPMPYLALQGMLDPFAPPGVRSYWRGEHLHELSDGAIDAYVDNAPVGLDLPTQMIIFRHGGAVSRVSEDATAFSHREPAYMFHPIAIWPDPARDDAHIDWVRRSSAAMKPFATGGVYLNFMSESPVQAGYTAEKWDRLVALKDRYDPTNMFRFNQNIPPSGA
jgi:FAD/FMN-containing dehydrogenase